MVYYISEVEHKNLINNLLPKAREVSVSSELRGWSWHQEPLKPYYADVKLPMYMVSGTYCPTARDIYLKYVENKEPELNHEVSLGIALHSATGFLYTNLRQNREPKFEEWWAKKNFEVTLKGNIAGIKACATLLWEYVLANAKAKKLSAQVEQPYASPEGIINTAIPFLIEHKISGELLGLSDILSVDCYDYLHGVIFDLKSSAIIEDANRLYPTGYAFVFESVYEVPIDIGCVTYVHFKNDRMNLHRDFFVINDDLRSWWIEERDKKLQIVAEKREPKKAEKCPANCIYAAVCD